MSGCCVATSLVACPGTSLPGTDPLGRGDWGRHCNSLLGLKLCNLLVLHFSGQQWTMFSTNVPIYHHHISQAGWNRCNVSIYSPLLSRSDHRRSFGLLFWVIRMHVLLDNVVMCVCCANMSWLQLFD